MTGSLPDRIEVAGHASVLARAWPSDGGALLVEYAAADDGRLRVGTWHPETGIALLPEGSDPRLPGLAPALAAGGVLLAHRPGKRAVVRMPDGRYRKLVRPGRAEGLALRHRRLAELLGATADVPAVLAIADGWVDLAALPGRPILGAERAAWEAAGRILAALRREDPADLPLHDAGAEAATTVRWLTAAADAGRLPRFDPHPLLAPLLAGPGPTRAAHRDLHDGQLLWDGARLGVLDADTLARAEPALDLANLLVHLELRVLQGLLPMGARREAEDAVLAAAAPDPDLRARMEAYAQATRLRLAAVHAFRPRWADAARALLARAGGPVTGG